jgi:hypothetical protein
MKKTVILFIAITAFSCRKPDAGPLIPAAPPDEGEVITTLRLTFADSATGAVTSYFFADPDGPGGEPAYYGPSPANQGDSVIVLDSMRTYFAELLFLNEGVSPADTISSEVMEEGEDHMIFYNPGTSVVQQPLTPYTLLLPSSGIRISYEDLDEGEPQRPIGLQTRWRTTKQALDKVAISLKHQPGEKDGTYNPGETELEVSFHIRVR